MTGDQTLEFFIIVLHNSLFVKQIADSMHFASSETSCVMVNFLQARKHDYDYIYVEKSTTEHNLLHCACTCNETCFYWFLSQSVVIKSCGLFTVKAMKENKNIQQRNLLGPITIFPY